jgi:hypothetical protein
MAGNSAGSAGAELISRLVSAVNADQWGAVTPSPYETARTTALAPWLPGHQRRVTWLLDGQGVDGTWGEGPYSYRLIPTLSAVHALLTVLLDDQRAVPASRRRLIAAVSAGVAALHAPTTANTRPDTAAAEIIVPGLVDRVNRLLRSSAPADLPSTIPLPPGYQTAKLRGLRTRLGKGHPVPPKFHHTFEAIAECCAASHLPASGGLLGSSPAATAAWLGRVPVETGRAAADELVAVSDRYQGLLPEAAPFATVERLWVASALARAGLPESSRSTMLCWVRDLYGAGGVRGAPGLAPDADDTAMAVHVAAALGAPRDPSPLHVFEMPSHFACYLGEDTGSVSTNAHVLHAVTSYVNHRPASAPAHAATLAKVRAWLLDQQTQDGCWTDKWHSSPYYATAHCVAAIAAHGRDQDALAAAARWTEQTQRNDGSWGHWTATLEETAYAVQILIAAPSTNVEALNRAYTFLREADDQQHRHPALWHDKTLYAPSAIIRAELIATKAMLSATLAGHLKEGSDA